MSTTHERAGRRVFTALASLTLLALMIFGIFWALARLIPPQDGASGGGSYTAISSDGAANVTSVWITYNMARPVPEGIASEVQIKWRVSNPNTATAVFSYAFLEDRYTKIGSCSDPRVTIRKSVPFPELPQLARQAVSFSGTSHITPITGDPYQRDPERTAGDLFTVLSIPVAALNYSGNNETAPFADEGVVSCSADLSQRWTATQTGYRLSIPDSHSGFAVGTNVTMGTEINVPTSERFFFSRGTEQPDVLEAADNYWLVEAEDQLADQYGTLSAVSNVSLSFEDEDRNTETRLLTFGTGMLLGTAMSWLLVILRTAYSWIV